MKQSFDPQFTAKQIAKYSQLRPALGFVLGSGFQDAVARMRVDVELPYAKLAGFPRVGVKGHAGKVLIGTLGGTAAVVVSGRAHFYEGHSMEQVTFAVRTLAEFGVRDLLVTNAGGINRK